MKKLLVLSGDPYHIPFIQQAVEMGYYVITCDYFPHNPGHQFAHEYHNVSYMDRAAVLALAKKLNIDGITCFAADEAMPIVGYVAQQLNLPCHPLEAIHIIHHKERFRSFLREHQFSVPVTKGFHTVEEARADFHLFQLPIIVKPVDSSGSRGVTKVTALEQLADAAKHALHYSRENRFLLEEYIETPFYQIGGDGFMRNGKLVFHCFSNNHLTDGGANPFIPLGGSLPSVLPEALHQKVVQEIERLISLLALNTGPLNVDIRINDNGDVYIIEMGLRNGGNYIPEITHYATGVNMIAYTIQAALGADCSELKLVHPTGYWSCYTVHSQTAGILQHVEMEPQFLQRHVVDYKSVIDVGAFVKGFNGSDEKIGTLLLRFSTQEETFYYMKHMQQFVQVQVTPQYVKYEVER